MKISNSKKQLAEIIHENGGWRGGIRAVYGVKTKMVCFLSESAGHPEYNPTRKAWVVLSAGVEAKFSSEPFANWHQTILSRDEYFHLYPAPVKVVVENKTTCHLTVTDKPTIEQLAADYRNRKDYADRKQQEADAAKADADAELAELVAAGKALGLVLRVAEPEPELVITDWRDLRVGDVVEVTGSDNPGWVRLKGVESLVMRIGPYENDVSFCPRNDDDGDWVMSDNTEWRFIRRPAKGDANA